MNRNVLLLILVSSLLSGFLSAQEMDRSRLNSILKSLELDAVRIKEELCVEKKIPNKENRYIVVIPVLVGKAEDEYNFTVQNYILITDEKGVIENKYLDPTELISDAVALRPFTIDTGLYTISTNIHAFGVKTTFVGSSRIFPYESERISMYYPEGKSLKKVLDQFEMGMNSGEWDGKCKGEFKDNHSYIIVNPPKMNTFSDLTIKTVSVTTVNKEVKEDCENKETSSTSFKTLQFRNGKYQ
ncbi:hypothetical protein [Chryseobacterium sp. JK1]|uniref:hypothetical protein n=1 Tax=Chryseobacterium sp. JK1 TaxID=874294 RepID=UPI003D6924E7